MGGWVVGVHRQQPHVSLSLTTNRTTCSPQAESPSKADMSRFKQMCIQLKNEPFSSGAGGAGGAGAKADA